MPGQTRAVRSEPALAAPARDRILRAAARLYARQGCAATSMREIAAAAGVTKPLVYYHFGSKQRLFSTLLRECMDACQQSAREALKRDAGARERLQEMLRAHFTHARQAPEVVAFAHEVMTMPGILPVGFDYRSEGRRLFELYVQLVEEGQRRGEFRRVDSRAVVVVAIASMTMYAAAVLAGEMPEIPAGVEDTIFDLMMRGVET